MSGQMSMAGIGWWPEPAHDVHGSSLDFIVDQIPVVGHRKGTWRESVRRPLAALYHRDRFGEDPAWMLRSKSPGRLPWRRIAKRHGSAVYLFDFLNGMERRTGDYKELLAPGLRACGVRINCGMALLPDLAPLVIAMCWDESVRAGCFLATAAAPLGYDWHASVDLALCQGLPWAERLAVLARKHEPLVRAWDWLHEQGQPHHLQPRPSS